jgi:hypothetical protein
MLIASFAATLSRSEEAQQFEKQSFPKRSSEEEAAKENEVSSRNQRFQVDIK